MNSVLKFIILKNNEEMQNIDLEIYLDDTIENVKCKLSQKLNIKNIENYYLFCKNRVSLNPYDIYKKLSYNNKKVITRQDYTCFCVNHSIQIKEDKDSYDLDDFLSLQLNDLLVDKPIGITNSIEFIVNPFKNSFDYSNTSNTTSKSLWLENNNIYNNIVYVLFANDIYQYIDEHKLETQRIINVYLPYLFKKDIYKLDKLNNDDSICPKYNEYNNIINFFNSNYIESDIKEGIYNIKFVLYPTQYFKFPLEIFFKLFNSSGKIPLIRLNSNRKQDSIYRLYCDQISDKGNKVPSLKKKAIQKYSNDLKGHNRICYVAFNKVSPILIEIMDNGHIYFTINELPIYNIKDTDNLIKSTTKDILENLSNYIDPSNKIFNEFISLVDKNIQIINLSYIFKFDRKKKPKFTDNINCFTSIFNHSDSKKDADGKKKYTLRYKRVSNFNVLDSMNAYLTESVNLQIPNEKIIDSFSRMFDTSFDDAKQYLKSFLDTAILDSDLNQNKIKKIKSNPGFLVEIKDNQEEQTIDAYVKLIDKIEYIPFLKLYISKFVDFLQGNLTDDENICKNKIKEVEVVEVEEKQPEIKNNIEYDDENDVVFNFEETDEQNRESLHKNKREFDEDDNHLQKKNGLLQFEDEEDDDEQFKNEELSPDNKSRFPPPKKNGLLQFEDEEDDDEQFENEELSPDNKKVEKNKTLPVKKSSLSENENENERFNFENNGSTSGGSLNSNSENNKIDLSTVRFGQKNPFVQKMEKKEPTLFISKQANGDKAYSRQCPWTDRRTPIILTKKELERIDKKARDGYTKHLEYGSDPKNPYYYICPRYWNFYTQTPVAPDKVDHSKVLDTNLKPSQMESLIHKGEKYIIELSGKNGQLFPYPGFLKSKKGDKIGLPCCFTKEQKTEKISQVIKSSERSQLKKKGIEINNTDEENNSNEKIQSKYIQNGDKFPLDINRMGHLPYSLELFFNQKHSECYINKKKSKFKIDKPCLMRMGVEKNRNQSFLAAIAYIFIKSDNVTIPKIQEIKKLIIKNLTIDKFVKYHDGNLPHIFSSENYSENSFDDYKESDLYYFMENDINSFKKIVSGYENFIEYIKSNEYIDHTYLWDIVCDGNVVSPHKINMVILKQHMDGTPDNLSILCPTTKHSKFSFNLEFPTFILYHRDDYYEPIITYSINKNNLYTINKKFKKSDMQFLSKSLELINKTIKEKCNDKILNRHYSFKDNITLDELILEINKLDNYEIIEQILNIDGKVFGLLINNKSHKYNFFVPCKPSGRVKEYNYRIVDNYIWLNYNWTTYLLRKLYKDSKMKIPCQPKLKIINKNNLILGIITITNQFVQLYIEEENIEDDLEEIVGKNPFIYDKKIIESDIKKYRQKDIEYMKLEQMFYNAFFNTIKILLNNSKYLNTRNMIDNIINSVDTTYENKFDALLHSLHEIFENNFEYISFSEEILDEIIQENKINICTNTKQKYCKFEKTNDLQLNGKLLIPIKNLLNEYENRILYENRFIDNLILNSYVQKTLLDELHINIHYTDKYNLNENEILLLESMLIPYLEDNMNLIKKIPFVLHRSFLELQPNQIYEEIEAKIPEEEPPEPNEPTNEFIIESEENEIEINNKLKEIEEITENLESQNNRISPVAEDSSPKSLSVKRTQPELNNKLSLYESENEVLSPIKENSSENEVLSPIKENSSENEVLSPIKENSSENEVLSPIKENSSENEVLSPI
jgi:hypothetical protein